MANIFYHSFFLLLSLYIFLSTVGYALYEINVSKHKAAGITIITLSVLITIFSNIMVLLY